MISENDKTKIGSIKEGLKSIEANLENLKYVYRTASNLFKISDKLEDNNLKSNIKGALTKINQTQYKEEIQQNVASIFTLILESEKVQQKEKIFFPNPIIRKTEEYKKDCEKYSHLKKNIEDLENKIINSDTYQKKLHEEIKQGKKWKKHLHARLTSNLRLMYSWDPETKILEFEEIITKNELDKN